MKTHVITRASTASATLLLLLLAACSGGASGSGEAREGGAAPSNGTLTPVAGCAGADFALASDPENGPTRCKAGAPAAEPLDDRATVTIAMSSTTAEFVSPILVGEAQGEFEKENLDVEINVLPPADSLQLLADGQIDATASSSSAAFFNALSQGFDIRNVMGQGWGRPESGAGVWAKGKDVELKDLAGMSFGSAVGIGSSANLYLSDELRREGNSLTDLSLETVDVADTVTALKNGSVDAAMVLDPFWVPLKGDPNFTFLLPQVRPGGDNGGIYFGPSLLEDNPEVGLAFTRAYIRTVNTYFAGDYKSDPKILQMQADAQDVPLDTVDDIPSYVFNWDLPPGVSDKLQDMYLEGDVLEYDEVLPEDEVLDRSFIEQAVGVERP